MTEREQLQVNLSVRAYVHALCTLHIAMKTNQGNTCFEISHLRAPLENALGEEKIH